jgi:hypothetical protein
MEMVAGRVVRLAGEWNAIIEEHERSHRSAAEFCRERGIAYTQFLYQRRKLLGKCSRSLAITRSATPPRARGFVPIRVDATSGIRIRFPMGLVLESDELPSAVWVAEVARRWVGAEEAPC